MIRNRWVLAIGSSMATVAVLIAVGVGVRAYAAASAASDVALTAATSTTDYCQQYQQALAQQLGKSTSQLQNANQTATKSVLDQMVKDGQITSAQEQQIEARLAADNNQLCGRGILRGHGGPGGALKGLITPAARTAVESAVASSLKISVATLESDLDNGKTIAQIATSQGVDISVVNSAYIGAVQSQLNSAVKANTITSAQESTALTQIKSAVSSGHYPGLEHGHGPHGQGEGSPAMPGASTSASSN